MSDVERLIDSILAFLRSPQASEGLSPDAAEGLTVAAQCLENSYGRTQPATAPIDLLQLFTRHAPPAPPAAAVPLTATASVLLGHGTIPIVTQGGQLQSPVSAEAKSASEALKNEGNALMKSEKYSEALAKYTEAIALDPNNPIFYCNRAAAHSNLKDNEAAIEDCKKALGLNPKYGRAYGRLGLALTNLNRHLEARDAYKIACQLEPQNEAYRNNLTITEETLRQQNQGGLPGLDLGGLPQIQTLTNVATQLLSDPAMQNLMGRLLGDLSSNPAAEAGTGNTGGGLNVLLQAGQQLAQQMQQSNPELMEQLRQHMTNMPPSQQPPKPPQ